MNNEMKIEYYLLQLDRELHLLPVSQRAEIITEIKSHIRDVMEKDPSRPLDQILQQDLGSAKTVSERYLSAKGLAHTPPPNRGGKVLKWMAVGTVAFFAMVFFAGMSAIWYFSPLIKVDEGKGRVVLLGGLIDVDEQIGQVKVGDLVFNDALKDTFEVQGEEDLSLLSGIRLIKIPFNTAKLLVRHSTGTKLMWDCKTAGENAPKVETNAGILTLNLDRLNLARCSIAIPAGSNTEIRGVNGHMELEYPSDNIAIALDNGKVKIHPDPAKIYDFEVKVKNGLQDFFPRSTAKNAVKVKVSVVNGLVKKE